MFKTASKNNQSRLNRSDFLSKDNIHGIDISTFIASCDEKESLILMKKELEYKISALKTSINEAKARYRGSIRGNPPNYETVIRWERDCNAAKVDIGKIEKRLINIKMEDKRNRLIEEQGFEFIFVKTAKSMLAGPVYEKIVEATLHKIKG